jgi:hypothetical protein
MPSPSQSWFDHPNDIWWGVQSIKLPVMQSSPLPCYLSLLRHKLPPQHPILEIVCHCVSQHLQQVQPKSKTSSRHAPHTVTVTPTSWLTSWDYAEKPSRTRTPRACTFPLADATCVQEMFTPLANRIRGWTTLFELSYALSLNVCHTFNIVWLGFHLSPVLKSSGKSCDYFLQMRKNSSESIFTMLCD